MGRATKQNTNCAEESRKEPKGIFAGDKDTKQTACKLQALGTLRVYLVAGEGLRAVEGNARGS
jgi:hypothetical protein